MEVAQLIAAAVFLSTLPLDTPYEPATIKPGDVPTDPTATVDKTPLKFTAVPAMTAKSMQSPRSMAEVAAVGARVTEGAGEGVLVEGAAEGVLVEGDDGTALGVVDGVFDGTAEGTADGVTDGVADGTAVAVTVGIAEGTSLVPGTKVGTADGMVV